MRNIEKPPLVMAGLVLGNLALGNLLGSIWPMAKVVLGCLGFLLYFCLIVGMMRYPQTTKQQLKDPLGASVFPTFFMSGMLLAGYVNQFFLADLVANLLWWGMFLGNAGLILYFTFRYVCKFSWQSVFPSWSVLFVGIAVSGLTAPVSGQYRVGEAVFWFGLVATICVLPLMAIRAYKIGLPELVKPNISTFCAPLYLLLASYLTTVSHPQKMMVWGLLIASQLLYFFVLVQLPILMKRPFNPGFSAFTFPFVISATSCKMALVLLEVTPFWFYLAYVEIAIATGLVAWVSVSYLLFLSKKVV